MYNISFPCVSNDESMRSSSLSPVFSKVGAAARPKSPPTLRRMYNDPPQPRTTVIYPFVYSDNSSKSIRDGRAGRLIDLLFLFDVNVCCADSPLGAVFVVRPSCSRSKGYSGPSACAIFIYQCISTERANYGPFWLSPSIQHMWACWYIGEGHAVCPCACDAGNLAWLVSRVLENLKIGRLHPEGP